MDLQDKVALVTGSGARLGQAIAQQLGQLGMRVIIHYGNDCQSNVIWWYTAGHLR